MKKIRIFPIVLILIVVVVTLLGYREFEKNYLEERYETQRTRIVHHLTSEEEDAEEERIKAFLSSHELFYEDRVLVRVYSGHKNNVDGTSMKTEIYIFIDGRLATDFQKAKALSDGYYTAMTLYYGYSKIEEYDIRVSVGSKYEFLNMEPIEVETTE